MSSINYEKNVEEVKLCADKIEQIIAKRPTLYRGPYGEYNDTVIKAAKEENHTTIQWSIDSLDWKGLEQKEMINRIEPKLRKGSIILMHNGTEHTAESLDTIISMIKENGHEIVPVSDLIYKGDYKINSQGVQEKI